MDKAAFSYNRKRKHGRINRMTPSDFEYQWCKNLLDRKPAITAFGNNENRLKRASLFGAVQTLTL